MMDPYFDDYQPMTTNKEVSVLTMQIKIYRNGDSNLCCSVTLRDNMKFHDIRRYLQQRWDVKFEKLRLFNQEGVEQTEDDLDYIKNGTVLFASRGKPAFN